MPLFIQDFKVVFPSCFVLDSDHQNEVAQTQNGSVYAYSLFSKETVRLTGAWQVPRGREKAGM